MEPPGNAERRPHWDPRWSEEAWDPSSEGVQGPPYRNRVTWQSGAEWDHEVQQEIE